MLIYKITNTKDNNKVYIGQTTLTLKERLDTHKRTFRHYLKVKRSESRLYDAVAKYGIDAFHAEVIELCSTQEELDKREDYWILKYRSNEEEFGYNIKRGGNSAKFPESVKENIGKTTKEKWENPETAAKMKAGLDKATKEWQRICEEKRWSAYCVVCGKEIKDLPPYLQKKRVVCSKSCLCVMNQEKCKLH